MRIEGTHRFAAPATQVWAVLTDAQALARCVPGCKALREVGPDQYEMDLEMGVGAIKGRYSGQVVLSEKVAPERYTLQLSATGTPGWMKGRWLLELTENSGETELAYAGDADVGGMVAGVGQRMLSGVAKMIMGQLFTALSREVAADRAAG